MYSGWQQVEEVARRSAGCSSEVRTIEKLPQGPQKKTEIQQFIHTHRIISHNDDFLHN
ncbi:hypothetical protein ALC53_04630 [Atta colombica]|uniref:Uncharacterized protein n=1 Tax=Atta colombica TaxID=520822 RepID=A0A195BL30_9HYME|nr:hypothetical protein ALC53_04630 [Atta colombica]